VYKINSVGILRESWGTGASYLPACTSN